MNLAVRIILITLLFGLPSRIRAQAAQELLEEVKRMAGELADMREANSAQNRRMTQMQKEIDSLREALRDQHDRATSKMGDFATREDLKKLVESVREVDQKRESDRKLILAEFEKLGRTFTQNSEKNERPKRNTRKEKEDHEPEKEPAPLDGNFLPVTVKPGQRLSDIQKEFNDELKQRGLPPVTMEQIKRANPKLNPDRIRAGQEVLLPVPEKKK